MVFVRSRMARGAALLVTLAIAAAALAQGGLRLVVNGKRASSDVMVINGRAYVPLDDMAALLGLTVVKTADGYEVTSPRTAPVLPERVTTAPGVTVAPNPSPLPPTTTQPATITPAPAPVRITTEKEKASHSATSGTFRISARDVAFVERYRERYHQPHRTLEPGAPGDVLVTVACRLYNETRRSQTPLLTSRSPGRTALLTADGRSFAPVAYDSRQESESTAGTAQAALTPGSYTDFVLLFNVPRGTQPRELVFTLGRDPEDAGKGTDVRFALPD